MTAFLRNMSKASNPVAELLVAGYQKFMENDFWGLGNASMPVKDCAQQQTGGRVARLTPDGRAPFIA